MEITFDMIIVLLCSISASGYDVKVNLKLTKESVVVIASARVRLEGPGNGLSSIDQTISGTLRVDYGSATSLCDLIPGLKHVGIGSVGGGSITVGCCGMSKTIHFPSSRVTLYDILPCDMLSL